MKTDPSITYHDIKEVTIDDTGITYVYGNGNMCRMKFSPSTDELYRMSKGKLCRMLMTSDKLPECIGKQVYVLVSCFAEADKRCADGHFENVEFQGVKSFISLNEALTSIGISDNLHTFGDITIYETTNSPSDGMPNTDITTYEVTCNGNLLYMIRRQSLESKGKLIAAVNEMMMKDESFFDEGYGSTAIDNAIKLGVKTTDNRKRV